MQIRKATLIIAIIVALVVGAGGSYAFTSYVDNKGTGIQSASEDNSNLTEVENAYQLIKENALAKPDAQQLQDGAIKGMLETLDDPYSSFLDEESSTQLNQQLESSFEGIGAEVSMVDKQVTIVAPIKDSPAEDAGLRPNDQVLQVDGDSLQGLDLQEAVNKIRGEKGTTVTLSVKRPGVSEELKIDVTRDEIPVETVYADTKEVNGKKAGVLEITSFSESTADEFKTALDKLEQEGIDGLTIDVRGNPGGILTTVEDILKNFVTSDKPYLQIEDKNGEKQEFYTELKEKKDYPINILIDEGSASASEILAGAMNQAGDYELIGKTTFGKGTVQQTVPLENESMLKLTLYKWLTPNGDWIHEKGIKPTVEVNQPEYFYSSPIQLDDNEKLAFNDNNDKIKNLQIMLDGLGYDPSRKDGYFNEKTESAVKQFQQDNDLQASGEVNQETADLLQTKIIEQVRDGKHDNQMDKALQQLFAN
ncbi:S41 family peptidase [Terribacillus saccharophilus]|nr:MULTISPECIES: S41 family peptidase [Terribacillus]MCM3226490.1 S41 family peptidase [Terribacillus saccharophilus]MEC0282209.1 S41 family peptidase [Terribacillus saccharophilus]MEC0289032.1 S41 family peptidase [Terribacillus saccharophilus]